MSSLYRLIQELYKSKSLLWQLTKSELSSKYRTHYLGGAWTFISPLLQISIYWFIFGLGIRGNAEVNGIPFLAWLICGLIPWLFIAPTLTAGTRSIISKLPLISKLKFPISILPNVVIMTNAVPFFVMLMMAICILTGYGYGPTIYYVQLIYYLFATAVLLLAILLFTATLTVIVRDIQLAMQSLVRFMFFLLPIVWVTDNLPDKFLFLLKLNPLYYLIDGYRMTLLGDGWFYSHPIELIYFWGVTLILLVFGAKSYEKFKNQFVDFI